MTHHRSRHGAGWTTTTPASQSWSLQLPGSFTDIDFDLQGTAEAVSRPRWQTDRALTTTTMATETARWIRHAIDPNQRPLTYRLLVSPDGMAIDSHSGTVAWTPTLAQVGMHQVILQAVNDQGAVAIDEWSISVTGPNSSPVITSVAPHVAYVDRRLTYTAIAQDAEDRLLSFALAGAPQAATIDARTGLFQWVPLFLTWVTIYSLPGH